jgi:hypothetical protein
VRVLRALLLVDALAIVVSTTFSDPILGDVVLLPALLIGLLLAIACLSADLVPPRRRIAVICSALTIVALCSVPFLMLSSTMGPLIVAVTVVALQAIPFVRRGPSGAAAGAATPGLRVVIAALVLSTLLLLLTVVALVWLGNTDLLRTPAEAFSRGPYLTRVTATDAEFAWQVKSRTGHVLMSLLAPDGTSVTAIDGRFSHLQPGTRYLWTANIDGSSRAAGAFRTAPTSTATAIALVAFGDFGSGSSHEYAVGRLAAAADPALFLSTGDNGYPIAAPPLLDHQIFDPLRALLAEAPAVAALGEHDLVWQDGAAVISALRLPGHHYSVQYGPVQVVVLGLEADSSALAFATKVLGSCGRSCPVRFVVTHRPIAASNPIMPLLRQRRVAAILAGHLHRYEHALRAGILEFTIGTGGVGPGSAAYTRPSPDAQVSSLDYGLLRIGIQGNRVSYAFIDESGHVRDHVAQNVGP